MQIVTLTVMIPVLFWYAYTVSDPDRARRRRRDQDSELAALSAQSVRLPRRRRFPLRRARRPEIQLAIASRPASRATVPAALPSHPLWDRWIDG
jgi:hypothetical protein